MTQYQIDQEIKSITNQLIQKYKPQKIILFGSAVMGKFGPDSDLDFLIVKEESPHYGVDRIREVERLIDTPLPCDFLVAKPREVEERLKLGDPFMQMIIKEGTVLY